MTGIYKIESPTGMVYIGQSRDIHKRWQLYRCRKNTIRQPIIDRSIIKYGHSSHIFSIAHELPVDVSNDVLTEYERIYMDAYRECGFLMMNIVAARGSAYSYKRPTDQVKRHAEKMRGRPSPKRGLKLSEEIKEKIRIKRKLQSNVKGVPKGNIPWNKGKKMPPGFVKGRPTSHETKEKLRTANLGKKLSAETIAKRTATLLANLKIKPRRGWSEESKRKQSERYLGKKKSNETLMKGRETRRIKKEANHGIS